METIQATNLHEKLKSWMRKSERVLVAYSGGVDSSFLAHVATESLGFENAVVVTGLSASVSDHQLEIGKRIAKANGFNHFMLETKEFENPRYRANDGIRCYFCKDELYGRLTRFRDERFPGYVVVDGTNFDDLKDVRHGIKAADQHGVLSPLALNKLGKSMIRELSKDAGLKHGTCRRALVWPREFKSVSKCQRRGLALLRKERRLFAKPASRSFGYVSMKNLRRSKSPLKKWRYPVFRNASLYCQQKFVSWASIM